MGIFNMLLRLFHILILNKNLHSTRKLNYDFK
jgi:hypothetical protein